MKRIIFILLLAVLSFSPAKGSDKWLRVEMANFTLVGPASEKDLRKTGNKLEQFRQTLARLMPNAKLDSSVPTTVYAFGNSDEFQSYFKYDKNERKIGGRFISTTDMNLMLFSIAPAHYDPLDVVFHEYFHSVTKNNLNFIPIWLNEGIAEYYSTFDIDEEGTKVKIGMPIPNRISELRKNDLIPFEKLFAVKQNSPEYRERDKAGQFYAQSWAFVHYLLNGNKGAREKQLFEFVNEMAKGTDSKLAFEKVFKTDFKSMEGELRNYIRQFTFPGYTYTLNAPVSWDKSAKVTQMSDADTLTSKGVIYWFSRNGEKAEKAFLESVAVDPNKDEANRWLGDIAESKKEFAAARKYYERALIAAPENYLNHLNMIGYFQADGDFQKAMEHARQAIRLKPNSARTQYALAALYDRQFSDTEASNSYYKAIQLNPEAGVNYFHLAKIAYRNNNYELALAGALAAIEKDKWRGNNSVKAALIAYFVYKREKKDVESAAMVQQAFANVDEKNFYVQVFKYLNGDMDDKKLLSLAKDTNDQTIANTYIATDFLLRSKTDEAKVKFAWVKENGSREFSEYGYAFKELERLELPVK